MTEIISLPCTQIVAGSNDRKIFDPAKLDELAASIRQNGLAQPITVRPLGGIYQIVAGERRFRAISQVLGWETIPAIVRRMTDEEAAAVMLAENTGRADLNPIEEANAYQVRTEQFGWSISHVASAAGVSDDRVKRRLSLLKLTPDAQALVANGHLPIGHAEALSPLDANRQRIALQVYREGKGVTLAQFRHITGELLAEQSQDALFDLANFWVAQVQKQDMPHRGKHAYTGAPTRSDLPPVQAEASDSTAAVIDRWISGLLERGLAQEAATAGTLYDALVRLNYLTVPPDAQLPGRKPEL